MKFLIMILTLSVPIYAQNQSTDHSEIQIKEAHRMFEMLVRTHPKREVAVEFSDWIENKKVRVISNTNTNSALIEVMLIPGPALVYQPQFFSKRFFEDPLDDIAYKQMVIYHEYTVLANHISGRQKMTGPFGLKDLTPEKEAIFARDYWRSEYLATRAEWEFAKKISKPHLRPDIASSIKLHGEKFGLLEQFHANLMKNLAHRVKLLGEAKVPEAARVKPIWEQLYQKEKAALSQ